MLFGAMQLLGAFVEPSTCGVAYLRITKNEDINFRTPKSDSTNILESQFRTYKVPRKGSEKLQKKIYGSFTSLSVAHSGV